MSAVINPTGPRSVLTTQLRVLTGCPNVGSGQSASTKAAIKNRIAFLIAELYATHFRNQEFKNEHAFAKAAEGTLTVGERAEIQAITNKYNTTIDVVGSRAAGNCLSSSGKQGGVELLFTDSASQTRMAPVIWTRRFRNLKYYPDEAHSLFCSPNAAFDGIDLCYWSRSLDLCRGSSPTDRKIVCRHECQRPKSF